MIARSRSPERNPRVAAALGMRTHSGWAAYVVLRGSAESPEIVARGRIELCDAAIKGSKQPFHEAEPMDPKAAERFIAACSASTASLANAGLKRILAAEPTICSGAILMASGRSLPGLTEILASHALIHAAEGEFYRAAVVQACERHGLDTHRFVEREIAGAAEQLPGREPDRLSRLDAFGRKVGPPWRQDEKLSALAAWLALAAKPSVRPAGNRHP